MPYTNFYQGYVKNSNPAFTMPNYRLGAPTSPMHAKQLEEFGKRLNEGIQNIEIGTLEATKFEYIPKEHFESIRQLSKLTGTKPSLHGALIDLAGFSRQGKWSEEERRGTREQVYSFIERAQAMDPTGNLPIVFHAGEATSQEFDESLRARYEEAGHKLKPHELPIRMMTLVNQDTGQVESVEFEERHRPNKEKPELWTPYEKLHSRNETLWTEEMLRLFTYQKELAELNERLELKRQQQEAIQKTGLAELPDYKEKNDAIGNDLSVIRGHMHEISTRFTSALTEAYDKVAKFKPENLSDEDYNKKLNEFRGHYDELNTYLKKNAATLQHFQQRERNAQSDEERQNAQFELFRINKDLKSMQEKAEKLLLNDFPNMGTPQVWRPVKDFAKEKTAVTVAEAMHKAYKKFGEASPFVAIENFWLHTAMSTGAELRDAVMQSRALLTKKLVDDGKHQHDAEKIAEKLIGATWDIGHINNLRKAGFEDEALRKKVIEETQRIADVTRHVHITDNFGFHDSHLPPGMGNVPVTEMMEALEKAGFQGRGIVEAGGFVAEIGGNPLQAVLSHFESPLYKMGAGPYWSNLQNQQAGYPSYLSTFVEFPQTHFSLYGSSFTTLPKELGGQVGGDKTRFSDTPNA